MKSIREIQERNNRVEIDKAWETSKTRRTIIALMTYVVAAVFMYHVGIADPFLNALVPTGGYIFSTLSMSFIKKWWVRVYADR